MDSDIIVLKDLSELFENDCIAAGVDDLSLCTSIQDKLHPWKNAPDLKNEIYINSGFVYFTEKYKKFFYRMYKSSLNNSCWEKYSDPLFPDNHFLCAFINLERIKIIRLDNYKYNWQGLASEKGYTIKLENNVLINTKTNEPVSLVHLSGKVPPDAHIRQMPDDIGSFLLKKTLPQLHEVGKKPHNIYDDILNMYFNLITRENLYEKQLVLEDDYYDVTIKPTPRGITSKPQESLKVEVEIINNSKSRYSSESSYPINISYHIYDQNKQTVIFDGLRTRLPKTIYPDEIFKTVISVISPEKGGNYLLQIDLVKEGIAWFQHRNKKNYKNVFLSVRS